MNRNEMLCGKN